MALMDLPCLAKAHLILMWAKQIQNQVKKEEMEHKENNHVKTVSWLVEAMTKHSKPKTPATAIPANGLPALSIRVTDRQNSRQDNSVHEVGDLFTELTTGVGQGNDERRSGDVFTCSTTQQSWVTRWNQTTDNNNSDNVEEQDSPEDQLRGSGNSLTVSLDGDDTQFGTTEREPSRNQSGADTFQHRLDKGTWIMPVLGPNVTGSVVWTTTANQDDGDDNEDENSSDFDDG
ncbi:hypothetical protein WICPIJ_007784 [Wickerhamomyces pijperi]|uniref:Uncharacterized protein n=1 Tax=Wickerhamomyces pijperi TaxID=599730 RepID=A0A9P8TJT1_WICPI|nr:hypothetical protein WICPIJ_007784 [Wickerhamomyces pijperi]